MEEILVLEPDVADMDIPPEVANEILRKMYSPNGVPCDPTWMREVIEREQDDWEF
jgi:hypothetical protein